MLEETRSCHINTNDTNVSAVGIGQGEVGKGGRQRRVETAEERRAKKLEKERLYAAEKRKRMSAEKKQEIRFSNRVRQARTRAVETPEQREKRLEADRERHRAARRKETEEQKRIRRETDRLRQMRKRSLWRLQKDNPLLNFSVNMNSSSIPYNFNLKGELEKEYQKSGSVFVSCSQVENGAENLLGYSQIKSEKDIFDGSCQRKTHTADENSSSCAENIEKLDDYCLSLAMQWAKKLQGYDLNRRSKIAVKVTNVFKEEDDTEDSLTPQNSDAFDGSNLVLIKTEIEDEIDN